MEIETMIKKIFSRASRLLRSCCLIVLWSYKMAGIVVVCCLLYLATTQSAYAQRPPDSQPWDQWVGTGNPTMVLNIDPQTVCAGQASTVRVSGGYTPHENNKQTGQIAWGYPSPPTIDGVTTPGGSSTSIFWNTNVGNGQIHTQNSFDYNITIPATVTEGMQYRVQLQVTLSSGYYTYTKIIQVSSGSPEPDDIPVKSYCNRVDDAMYPSVGGTFPDYDTRITFYDAVGAGIANPPAINRAGTYYYYRTPDGSKPVVSTQNLTSHASFIGSSISSTFNPVVMGNLDPAIAGTYTYWVGYIDPGVGCLSPMKSITYEIRPNIKPAPSYNTATAKTTVCDGETVIFDFAGEPNQYTPGGYVTYVWESAMTGTYYEIDDIDLVNENYRKATVTFNNPTTTTQTVTLRVHRKWNSAPTVPPDPASCPFSATDCQTCRSDSRTITVTVLPKPTATLRIAQGAGFVTSTTICATETRNLNLTGFSTDPAGHVIKIDWQNTTNTTNGQIGPITITDASSQNIPLPLGTAVTAEGTTEYWISEIGKGDCDPIQIDPMNAVKVTINRLPLLSLAGRTINGPETVCEGTANVIFSVFPSLTKPAGAEFVWYYDAPPPVPGETENFIDIDFTGSTVGTTHTLQVGLRYTTAPACESDLVPAGYKRITIHARPTATYSPALRNICEGETVVIPIELTGNPAVGDNSNDWNVKWQLLRTATATFSGATLEDEGYLSPVPETNDGYAQVNHDITTLITGGGFWWYRISEVSQGSACVNSTIGAEKPITVRARPKVFIETQPLPLFCPSKPDYPVDLRVTGISGTDMANTIILSYTADGYTGALPAITGLSSGDQFTLRIPAYALTLPITEISLNLTQIGGCPSGDPEKFDVVKETVPDADAKDDGGTSNNYSICGMTQPGDPLYTTYPGVYAIMLDANIPTGDEAGVWTIESGPVGGVIDNAGAAFSPGSPNAVFHTSVTGTWLLRWTVFPDNGSGGANWLSQCQGVSDAVVTIAAAPTQATILNKSRNVACYDLANPIPFELFASPPYIGEVGEWKLDPTYTYPDAGGNGSSVVFDDKNNYETTVTVGEYGLYKFIWTIDNGCPPGTEDFIIVDFKHLELGIMDGGVLKPIPDDLSWCAGSNTDEMPTWVSNGAISWRFPTGLPGAIPGFTSATGNGQSTFSGIDIGQVAYKRTYHLEVIAVDGTCRISQDVPIEIRPQPSAVRIRPESFVTNSPTGNIHTLSVCSGSWINFELSPNLYDDTEYDWNAVSGNFASVITGASNYAKPKPTSPPTSAWRFQVTNTTANPIPVTINGLKATVDGCESPDPGMTMNLTVNPTPVFTPTPIDFCPETDVNTGISIVTSTLPSATTFEWETSSTNPSIIGYALPPTGLGNNTLGSDASGSFVAGEFRSAENSSGRAITHTLTVTATAYGCEYTDYIPITLKVSPEIDLQSNRYLCSDPAATGVTFPDITFATNLGVGNADFEWTFTPPGSAIPTEDGDTNRPGNEVTGILTFPNNNTSDVQTYTWWVQATGTNASSDGCKSEPVEFYYRVFPLVELDDVVPPTSLETCGANDRFSDINFRSSVTDAEYSWVITEDYIDGNTGAVRTSGATSPITFNQANNTGSADYVATVRITPYYPHLYAPGGRCAGIPSDVSLTVKPAPVMEQPPNIEVCSATAYTGSEWGVTMFDVTNASNFAAGDLVFDWVVTSDVIWNIGMNSAPAGVTSFPAFNTTTHTGTSNRLPVTVTVNARDKNTGGCSSDPVKFTITQRSVPELLGATGTLYQEITACPGDIVSNRSFYTNLPGGAIGGAWEVFWELTGDEISPEIAVGDDGQFDIGTFLVENDGNGSGAGGEAVGIFKLTVKRDYTSLPYQCQAPVYDFKVTVNPRPAEPTLVGNPTTEYCPSTDVADEVTLEFTSTTSGVTYVWETDHPSLFGGASWDESDEIVFQPTNNTLNQFSARVANMQVYAQKGMSSNGSLCQSEPLEFAIKIKPVPQFADNYPKGTYALCSGSPFNDIEFRLDNRFNVYSDAAGATKYYLEVTDNGLIADATSVTGSFPVDGTVTAGTATGAPLVVPAYTLPSFTPVIDGSDPKSFTLSVTPEHAGCEGDKVDITVIANPTPVISLPAGLDLEVCSGENFNNGSNITVLSTVTIAAWNLGFEKPATYDANSTTNAFLSGNTITFPTAATSVNINDVAGYSEKLILNGVVTSVAGMGSCVAQFDKDYYFTVKQAPTLAISPAGVIACSGDLVKTIGIGKATAQTTLPTGTTYSWTTSNAGVWESTSGGTAPDEWTGLGDDGTLAAGTTLFPTFKTVGNKTGTIIGDRNATVSVTAHSGNGCKSGAQTFGITVRPEPVLTSSVAAQTVCEGATVENVPFVTNVSGANVSVNWTIDAASDDIFSTKAGYSDAIDGVTEGTGPISFTAGNSTSGATGTPDTETATFDIYVKMINWEVGDPNEGEGPAYCESQPYSLTINVLPKPVIIATPASLGTPPVAVAGGTFVYCPGDNIPTITFTTNPEIDDASYESLSWTAAGAVGIGGSVNALTTTTVGGSLDFGGFQANHATNSIQSKTVNVSVAAGIGVKPDNSVCAADPLNFTVVLKPKPEVSITHTDTDFDAATLTLEKCSGLPFTSPSVGLPAGFVPYSATLADTKFNWAITEDWFADGTKVELPLQAGTLPVAPGSPESPTGTPITPISLFSAFTANIFGSSQLSAVFTITPEHAGCTGESKDFTLTINPAPVITLPTEISVCAGDAIPTIDIINDGYINTASTFSSISFSPGLQPDPGTSYIAGYSNMTIDGVITFSNSTAVLDHSEYSGSKLSFTATAISGGCISLPHTVEFIVNQRPLLTLPLDNPVFCSNFMVPANSISFNVSNMLAANLDATQAYNWTVGGDAVSTGGLVSGNSAPTAGIPTFTTVNHTSGTSNLQADVMVWAKHENGCESGKMPFTIDVRPVLTVNSIPAETVCPDATITAKTFTANITTDTQVTWTFADDATSTIVGSVTSGGPLTTGSGATPEFVTANSTSALRTGNFNATASYASGGPVCTSVTANVFAVTVKPTPPTPAIATFSGQAPGVYLTSTPAAPGTWPWFPTANSLIFCNGDNVPNIYFPVLSTGNTYTWTIDNTADIGDKAMANAGTGNRELSAFKIQNTTAGVATFAVRSVVNSCPSEPFTFTIAVKPTPVLASLTNIDECSDIPITPDAFRLTSPVTVNDANTVYRWSVGNYTNGTISNLVGLTATGVSNNASVRPFALPSFTGSLTGSSQMSAIVAVTPEYDGCTGTPQNMTVVIHPTPPLIVTNNNPSEICSGDQLFTIDISTGGVASTLRWEPNQLVVSDGVTGGEISMGITPGLINFDGSYYGTASSITFDRPALFTARDVMNSGNDVFTGIIKVTAKSISNSCEAVKNIELKIGQAPVMGSLDAIIACSNELITADEANGGLNPNKETLLSVINDVDVSEYNWTIGNPAMWEGDAKTSSSITPDPDPLILTYLPDFTTYANKTTAPVASMTTAVQVFAKHATTGCISHDNRSFALTVRPLPQVTSTHNIDPVCPGPPNTVTFGNITTNLDGGVALSSYTWVDWELDNTSISTAASITSGSGTAPITSFVPAPYPAPAPPDHLDNNTGIFTLTPHARWLLLNGDVQNCEGETMDVVVQVKPTPAQPEIVTPNTLPADMRFCHNDDVPRIDFQSTESVTTYNWSLVAGSDNINLTASANNYIPTFKILNNQNSPASDPNYQLAEGTATITVTAVLNECPSIPNTFDITVKRVPQMIGWAAMSVCSEPATAYTPASFGFTTDFPLPSGPPAPDLPEYGFTWTLSGNYADAGFTSDSGTGNLPAFTPPTPSDNTTRTVNVTVTPVYEGCDGNLVNSGITIYPRPRVIFDSPLITNLPQSVCSGIEFMPVSFHTTVDSDISWSIPTPPTDIDTYIHALSGNSGSITFTDKAINTNPAYTTYTAPITIIVTNSLLSGCSTAVTQDLLTIRQAPAVSTLDNILACSNEVFSNPTAGAVNPPIELTVEGGVSASKYRWTIGTPSIWDMTDTEVTTAPFVLPRFTINPNEDASSDDISTTVTVYATHVTTGCESAGKPFTITVRPLPKLSAAPGSQTVCSGEVTIGAATAIPVDARLYWETGTGHEEILANPAQFVTGTGFSVNPVVVANTTALERVGRYVVTSQIERITGDPLQGYCPGESRNFTITVYPKPTQPVFVDPTFEREFCHGTEVGPIEFVPTGIDIFWTRSGQNVGLPGIANTEISGDIPLFTATSNTTTSRRVTNISVIARSSDNECPSDTLNFTLTLKPKPQMVEFTVEECSNTDPLPAPQTSYNFPSFQLISGIEDNTNFPGETPSFKWRISDGWIPDQGLPEGENASGDFVYEIYDNITGYQITGFTPYNAGNNVHPMTLTVYPQYAGCTGDSVDLDILIKPLPQITNITDANQEVCHGTGFTNILFTSSVAGSTFYWEIEQPSTTSDPLHGVDQLGVSTQINEGVVSATNNRLNFSDLAYNNTNLAMYTGTVSVTATAAGCVGPTAAGQLVVLQAPVMQSFTQPVNACLDSKYLDEFPPVEFKTANTIDPTLEYYFNWNIGNSTLWDIGQSGTATVPVLPDLPHLPDFTAMSVGTSAITVTATVIHEKDPYTGDIIKACTSKPESLGITVWGTSLINGVVPMALCPNDDYSIPMYSTSPSGADIRWVASVTAEDVSSDFAGPASGLFGPVSGNQPPTFRTKPNLAANNAPDGDPILGSIWLTAMTSHGTITCPGKPVELKLTLNPTPMTPEFVDPLPNVLDFCHGVLVDEIEFKSATTGNVVFEWKRLPVGGSVLYEDNVGQTDIGEGHFYGFRALNTTTGQRGFSRATYEVNAVKEGCPSVPGLMTFEVVVKPVPQLDDITKYDLELCASEEYDFKEFKIHPDIVANYPSDLNAYISNIASFEWRIENSGWIPESGLPDPALGYHTINPPQFVDLSNPPQPFRPDITADPGNGFSNYYKPGSTTDRHPLWGETQTFMTMMVTPSYAECDALPVPVMITLNPLPITNIIPYDDNKCVQDHGNMVFFANNGRPTFGSTYTWDIEHDPSLDPQYPFPIINNGGHIGNLLFPEPDNMSTYDGTLTLIETNRLGCNGNKIEFAVHAVPTPIVRAAPLGEDLLFEVCVGNEKQLNGVLVNEAKLTNAGNMTYEWLGYYLPDYLLDETTQNDRNSLTPWLRGDRDGFIRLRAIDDDNGCISEWSTLQIVVYDSPLLPQVPIVTVCEAYDQNNMLSPMTMTLSNPDPNEHIYWRRMDGATTVPVDDGMNLTSVDMRNTLPPLTWVAGQNQQIIYYQVYRTKEIPGKNLICASPTARTELRINKTPDAPRDTAFAYCENKDWIWYSLTTRTTATGGVNWFGIDSDDGVYKHLGPGNSIMVKQPGNSTANNSGNPFIFNAVSTSSAGCNSDPAVISLMIYQNPVLSFDMYDKDNNLITTSGGCSPFDLTAVNTSLDPNVDYLWIWSSLPNDNEPAPPGLVVADGQTHTYLTAEGMTLYRVQLSAVSKNQETGSGRFCSSMLEKTLLVSPGVTADFYVSPNDTVGCDGMTVYFMDQSRGAHNYRWYWNRENLGPPTYMPGNPEYPISDPNSPLYGIFGPSSLLKTFDYRDSNTPKRYHVWLQVDNGVCHDNKDAIISIYPVPKASFDHNLTDGTICSPLPVKFTNTSSGFANNALTRYAWDYADGFMDTTKIVTPPIEHIYENRLSSMIHYMIRMNAFNNYAIPGGDSLTCTSPAFSKQITVYPQVEAKFSGTEKGCSPVDALFSSQASAPYYSWDFGDGSIPVTGSNPTHTFINSTPDQVKNYRVILTASNSWCNDTVSHPFTLYPQPVASFAVDSLSGCQPLTVTYTNTSFGNPLTDISYIFDFGDGYAKNTDDINEIVSHQYINVGGTELHMNPKLTAVTRWDQLQCFSVPYDEKRITIFPYLKAKFEMEDSIGCSPLTVWFRNGSLGYDTYQYDFGDGDFTPPRDPSLGNIINHPYKADNMYQNKTFNVTLTVRRGNCMDTQSKQVLVYSSPTANFRLNPNVIDFPYPSGPIGIVNQIPSPDLDYLDYKWSWSDTETGYAEEFDHSKNPGQLTLTDWGHFSVTQVVTSQNAGRCTDKKILEFNIVPPLAKPSFEPLPPNCMPYDVRFENTSQYARSYKWDFGDGNLSSEKNPMHTYMMADTFTVILTVMGYDMVSQTTSQKVVVYPTPQAGFEISPKFLWVGQKAISTNFTKHVNNSGQPYDIWYRWDWGDGSSVDTDESPTHMYSKPGTFDITLTVGTNTVPQCTSTVTMHDAVKLESAGDMILPNTFKPNTEGEPSDVIPISGYKNYLFYPPLISATRKYSLMVFNRWGQLLYQTNDQNRGWNGYFRGRLCDEDVYMYKIEGVYETGQSFSKIGDMLLLR